MNDLPMSSVEQRAPDADRAYWMSELWNAILRLGGKHKDELLAVFAKAEAAVTSQGAAALREQPEASYKLAAEYVAMLLQRAARRIMSKSPRVADDLLGYRTILLLGLTAEQQPVQEGGGECPKCRDTGEVCTGYIDGTPEMFDCTCPAAAPPSAPVGVGGLLSRAYEAVRHGIGCPAIKGNGDADCDCGAVTFLRDLECALTQQPAQAAPGDDKVLWGVVANAGRLSPTRQQRWAHVMDATGQGSQSSIALCRRFGFDPDETVGVEEDTPPGDDAAGGG